MAVEQCFTFLEGIGDKTAAFLRGGGIADWNDFLQFRHIKGISKQRKLYYDRKLVQAKYALQHLDSAFFAENFPQKESWRLYLLFKKSCCFLDVEVDSSGRIIIVTLYDRFDSRTFVKGRNLEKQLIQSVLSSYNLIITYNGSAFDLIKLYQQLGILISAVHIDLKPLCQRLGLCGGLKEIEKQLGISRPRNLSGNASGLWKAFWASGDNEWLELLVRYNEEDTINLHQLIEICYQKMCEKTAGFEEDGIVLTA